MAVRPADRRLGMMSPWPGALGGAEDGPQIVGVGDLVAHHQQGRLPLGGGAVQNALDADVFPDGGQGDDSLVGVGAAHGVQLPPVGLHHNDPGVPREAMLAQGLVRLALGQVNFVDGRSGPQGLDHGVPALDDAVGLRLGHGPSVFVVFHGAISSFSTIFLQYTIFFGQDKAPGTQIFRHFSRRPSL